MAHFALFAFGYGNFQGAFAYFDHFDRFDENTFYDGSFGNSLEMFISEFLLGFG